LAGYLLDTNVISELVRPAPEARVLAWIEAQGAADLHISAITLGELLRGVTRLPPSRRREALRRWVEHDLASQFEGRVLPFDRQAAEIWGALMGDGDRSGRPRATLDTQIAAIALAQELILVTRNVADFAGLSVRTLDPWRQG
jgi:toxin FitB